MRSAECNKQTIYYALFTGYTDATDDDGYKTGEKTTTYADPVAFRINVSAAKGATSQEPFGLEQNYSRTMNTCDMNCPIAVDTLVWVGRTPTTAPHNYRVSRVAPGLFNIVYALEEVSVNGSQWTPPTPTPDPEPEPDPDEDDDGTP